MVDPTISRVRMRDLARLGPLRPGCSRRSRLSPCVRFAELAADPTQTNGILALGADKARKTAGATMARVRDRLGLPAV